MAETAASLSGAAPVAPERTGPYRTSVISPEGLPFCIEPTDDADVGRLCDWLRGNADWVQDRLTRHGALLFRGFPIFDAPTFERVARAVDDHLKNEYLGTSPRNGLTDYVFTASELPPFFPIPEHCEMSFVAHPPERVFFCCLLAPAPDSGETPLVDFRAVWRDLDPDVRARFERGGIRIVRNYAGPGGGSKLDLWQLKRWDEMFLTTDKAAVEAKCREEGFEVQWGPHDSLCLISTQPVRGWSRCTGWVLMRQRLSFGPHCTSKPSSRHLASTTALSVVRNISSQRFNCHRSNFEPPPGPA